MEEAISVTDKLECISNALDTVICTVKFSNEEKVNISSDELFSLARLQLSQGIKWSIESCNLDGSNSMEYTYSYPQQKLYVMIPSKDSIDTSKAKINEYLGDNNE